MATTAPANVPSAPEAPEVPAAPAPLTAELTAALALMASDPAEFARLFPELAPLAARVRPAKAKTASDYRREVDLAIISYAGNLVAGLVPEEFREEVGRLVANQLHHLSTPALGWPSDLPRPARSDWR